MGNIKQLQPEVVGMIKITGKKKKLQCNTGGRVWLFKEASCSAIIQRTLPEKENDLGRDTLHVTIGNFNMAKTLVDLGASINLIPFPVV